MARTIAVSNDVYELLKKSKLPGESFSTLIKRSLGRKKHLSDIVGSRTISREDWRKISSRIRLAEERSAKTLKERS